MTLFVPTVYCEEDMKYKTKLEIELQEKLDVAAEALEFYASKQHKILVKNGITVKDLIESDFSSYVGYTNDILTIENGKKAREALAKIKGIKG